ncbi:hypothetical protein FOZ62_004976 [Perkinsus olseni]|uniref:Uncharacterized protein n=1 Tax=Perkinsus olseni TaxID=32597 RepID=A0A7J6T3D0_PEROL|nr:hypothetical protein FOZ62_004976 [Perkinsus olseni]
MNPFDTPPGLETLGLSNGLGCRDSPLARDGVSAVKPISELNRYACPFVPSTDSNNQQKENGVAQEVQQASRSVGETVHYESCTLQFTAVNKGSDGEEEAMNMIAVYQPTNHVLQSCVTAGRCCIPWHAKSPHIHMVPMLYNAPAAAISDAVPDGDNELENPPQSVGRKDDSSVSEGDNCQPLSAKKMLRIMSGRWYCPTEARGFEYEIRGSSVTKSERREKDKSEFSSLWKKRLVIKKGAIYWSSSLNYVLSKTKFTRNEINWESTTGKMGWTWLRVPYTSESDAPSTGRGNDRAAAATRRAPKALAAKFEATRNTGRRWCDMESSDEDDDCSVEQDNVWARSSVSDAPSPRSDIENVAPNRGICETDDAASRSAATEEPGTPSWKEPRGDDKTRPHAASLSSGSTSTAEPTPVPVPSYPPPAPSYPPPGIYHDPPQYAATVEGMIPVFHPSGPFPECVVQGGACPIPWHPKEPHVHVMHVLFNAPDNSANVTNETGTDSEKERPIQWESAKKVLEAVKGRWFCSSEGPGMVYEINAKRKRVAKLWIDEDGNAVSRIWEKNLVIDSLDIYWGNSQSYFLSKKHLYENELKWESTRGGRGWRWQRGRPSE